MSSPRSIMKFVVLALAVLLATGCQAQYLQADRQSEYERVRAVVVTYLGQVKEGALKAINHLGDGEFREYKEHLTQSVYNIQHWLEYASDSLSFIRTGPGPEIVYTVSSFYETVRHELEELHKELEPKCGELLQVVKKHLEEYRGKLEPPLKEYSEKNRQQVEEFRIKMEPVLKELKEKMSVNMEETKSKLTPIVEIIRNKLTQKVEYLKARYGEDLQQYRKYIEKLYSHWRGKYQSGELQEKVTELYMELKPQLWQMYETIYKTFDSMSFTR